MPILMGSAAKAADVAMASANPRAAHKRDRFIMVSPWLCFLFSGLVSCFYGNRASSTARDGRGIFGAVAVIDGRTSKREYQRVSFGWSARQFNAPNRKSR